MTNFAIAMLAGLLLALVIATAQQKWSCKVFFLLALRLAIGWHFLFEGMHKINSHWIGVTEWNKPFTSEPYFKASPTQIGKYLSSLYLNEKAPKFFQTTESLTRDQFLQRSPSEQAQLCPHGVRRELSALAEQQNERHLLDRQQPVISDEKVEQLLIQYTRWVYGIDGRNTKINRINGDVVLSVPQRQEQILATRQRLEVMERQLQEGIGTGRGMTELTRRIADLQNQIRNMESDLELDARNFVNELAGTISPGYSVPSLDETRGQRLDRFTMWFIAIIGACLLLGFCTRLSCVLAAGFLVMTYIIHPPFPWYPLPPNTEGNPVFINKNVIECLALLAIACFPSGKWLGIDAILCRFCPCRKRTPSTTVSHGDHNGP